MYICVFGYVKHSTSMFFIMVLGRGILRERERKREREIERERERGGEKGTLNDTLENSKMYTMYSECVFLNYYSPFFLYRINCLQKTR